MKRFRIGVVRVITLRDRRLLESHGRIMERAYPDIETSSICIEDQPKGIFDESSERIAIPKIVEAGKKLLKENVDAIFVSCVADPAVEDLRRIAAGRPVFGAGKPLAALALTISSRVGVLGIGEEPPKPLATTLGDALISYRRPSRVSATTDLADSLDAIIEAAGRLRGDGAEVIALGCTGFSTLGMAARLQRLLKIPVLDPILAAASVIHHELIRTSILDKVLEAE